MVAKYAQAYITGIRVLYGVMISATGGRVNNKTPFIQINQLLT